MGEKMIKELKGLIFTFLFTVPCFAADFDHSYSQYNRLLKEVVVKKGPQTLVKYSTIKKSPTLLNKVLAQLSKVSRQSYEKWNKNQKLAFLINSYNAFTLKLIVDHYPVKTIKDIGSFFSSPWKKEFFTLLGKETYLDYIEHEMIRKDFKEPRIHFAVNCASMGCPSLARDAFRGDVLDNQLKKAAESFIKNRLRNRLEVKEKTLYLSKIFKWYGDDFKEMTGVGFRQYISKFLPAYKPKEFKVEFLDYDWSLNEAPR
jgi:hypothetical protein